MKVERPLLLSVAWAANIGGMATLIGTPPNMIFAGFLSENLDREIGFVEWLPLDCLLQLVWVLSHFSFWRAVFAVLNFLVQQERIQRVFEKRMGKTW